MGEDYDNYIKEIQETISNIKDAKVIKRLHGIIKLQIEKEEEESNIIRLINIAFLLFCKLFLVCLIHHLSLQKCRKAYQSILYHPYSINCE